MAIHRCSHPHRTTGVLNCDFSRSTHETALYSAQLTVSICPDCGRILHWHCKTPATVCAWLKNEPTASPAAADK